MEVLEPRELAQGSNYGSIPDELKRLKRWVCWKLEERRDKNGKPRLDKVPYFPNTSCRASTTDSRTWASYEAALATFTRSPEYNGLGFVFSDADDYVFLDLDKCVSDEGVSELARWILEQAVSYTEVSQSGTGLHVIVRGRKPGDACKNSTLGFEMYATGRFCAMTGDVYDGRSAITACDEALERVYRRVWPNVKQKKTPRSIHPRVANDAADEDVLKRARRASDGERFERLWAGEWEAEVGSQSEADAALCAMLMRAAKGDVEQTDALFRESGLYRDKWGERHGELTYGETTLNYVSNAYQPTRQGPKQTLVVLHARPWLNSTEMEKERAKKLRGVARDAGRAVVRKPGSFEDAAAVRIIAEPPGTGKTHAIADEGRPTRKHPQGKHDIGLIVERENQTESVNFYGWHVQEGCNQTNCPDGWQLHQTLAALGYNTAGIHKAHNCRYWQQMEREGSTIYQVEHVGTAYLREHEVYVIDEFNLPKWIPAQHFTKDALLAARAKYQPTEDAYVLLEAATHVLVSATGSSQGKPLFDAVDGYCGGQLADVVTRLAGKDKEMRERPYAEADTLSDAEALPPVVLPKLVRVLAAELAKWQTGRDWNSHLRVTRQGNGWALCLSEKRVLAAGRQVRVMDGTADVEILRRFFGRPVRVSRSTVEPMAGARHIAARGTRFGKTNLTESANRADVLRRAIGRIRYLLNTYCREGATVGLITFKRLLPNADGEGRELVDALGVTEERWLNFWGQRGSNDLADMEVLIVLGTPAWNPDDVARMGRVLYAEDDKPIDETFEMGRYADERLQHIADHLTRSELTQSVHRSRALRYPNRTVITLTDVEVDYLPMTHEVTQFATLTEDGRPMAEAKLDQRMNALTAAAAA